MQRELLLLQLHNLAFSLLRRCAPPFPLRMRGRMATSAASSCRRARARQWQAPGGTIPYGPIRGFHAGRACLAPYQKENPDALANLLPKAHEDHVPAKAEPDHLPLPIHPPARPHAITLISHVKGDRSIPLISKPIGAFFDEQVDLYGDKEALRVVHQDIRWSWNDLQRQVDAFSQGLLDLGFEKGDRLGIWLPNTAEWVVAEFATAKTGIILVNVNPAYRVYELEHSLNLVGCKGLIVTDKLKSSNYFELLHELLPELEHSAAGELNSTKVPTLKHLIQITDQHVKGMRRYVDVLSEKASSPDTRQNLKSLAQAQHVDDAINIQFTSGTTGLPKGATLTHLNILNNGFFAGERMGLTPDDTLCVPVPLYHCFGLVLGNLAAFTHGAKVVYPSPSYDPLKVLEAVQEEKCTGLHGVPTMFISELEHPRFKEFDLSSLRTGIMAGSPCPIEVMKRVVNEMHMKDVTITYGMTETSPGSFQTEGNSPLEKRVETVGRVHPHTECKIVDTEGRTVPVGHVGELCTKGYLVMKGYWNNPKKTEESIDAGGWMHTGDLAVFDEDGFCKIVGRSKDVIIRGGENVYPREIEEFLYTHPAIEDVQVIGVPNRKYGEKVCAWIKKKDNTKARAVTAEDIHAFCKDKIAHYKIPEYVVFKEEFPMTVTGKYMKHKMREQTIAELHLEKEVVATA